MMDLDIPRGVQMILLRLARTSIQDAILKDGSLEAALSKVELTPPLLLTMGLFVTLREAGGERRLRGCIGTMSSAKPLYRTVIATAPKAALEDPRFSPLGEDELPEMHISLSVLSPPQPLDDLEELVLGRDGLQLERGAYRSVFLPQVAPEQGWNRQQFLERLAMKAGLPKDGWRQASLFTFRALLFEE
jgi:AmmeMemoRadiSam system protein A